MISILILAAFSPLKAEYDEQYESYRHCVMAEAEILIPTAASGEEIFLAAKSQCRADRAALEAIVAVHNVIMATERNEPSSENFGHNPDAYHVRQIEELHEDVVYFVLSSRKSEAGGATQK